MAWGLSLSTSQSTNEAGNQSTVSASLFLTWSNANRYSGTSTSGSINIGGNVIGFTGPTSGGSTAQTGSQFLASHAVTFTHDANGVRGAVGTSAAFDAAPNQFAPQNLSTSGTTFGAIDYDRRPAVPTSLVATLNANKTVTVTSNSVSSPAGTATYRIEREESTNNGATWSGYGNETTSTSTSQTLSLAFGKLYRFRVRVSNSDGFSGYYTPGQTLFVPAGGKIWNGTTFNNATTSQIWKGSSWSTITTAKRFNGTSWVDLQ
jgi:hypothetical protein